MSLILDALNRSRDEANPVPGLATHHAVEQVTADRRQYLLWVALSVAVVIIAWLALERFSPAPSPAPEIAAADAATAAAAGAAVGNTQADVPPAATAAEKVTGTTVPSAFPAGPVTPPNTGSAVQPATAPQAAAAPVAVVSSAPAPAPAAEQVSAADPLAAEHAPDLSAATASAITAPSRSQAQSDAVAQLYENPDLPEEPAPANSARQIAQPRVASGDSASSSTVPAAGDPIDIDRMLRMAREEVENAGLGDHPVPFLIDLSQQTKDSIPTVHYLRHDYSSNASQSTVVLNSKTLAVGGSPLPGMKVEEILQDSVVLNYQGTQFRLRALNSWINL